MRLPLRRLDPGRAPRALHTEPPVAPGALSKLGMGDGMQFTAALEPHSIANLVRRTLVDDQAQDFDASDDGADLICPNALAVAACHGWIFS